MEGQILPSRTHERHDKGQLHEMGDHRYKWDVATFHFEIYIHLMDTGGGSPWGGLPPELDSLHYRIEKDVRVNVRDRTLADGSGVVHLWSVIEDDVVWHLDMRSPVDVQNHPKARPFYTSDITNITPKGITVRWDYPLNIPYKGKNFTDVFVMTGATYTNESLSANLEFSRDLSIYVENLYGAWGGWTHMFHAGFSLMQLYDGDSGLMIAGWMDDIVIEELNFVSPLGVALNDTNIFDTQQVFPWEILLLPLAGAMAGVAIWVWWKFRK